MPTLDWLGRQDAFTTAARVPYRLLEPISQHGEPQAAQHNLLIQGDNLQALKSLLPFYRSRVKCIFIDPPYNTQSAFEHYDDNLEHAQWLTLMLPRLQLLRDLLREDGSIWVTIDDNEGHYLKVLMDEVFGRGNFVTTVLWRKNYSPKSTARHFSEDHDYVLVYAKSGATWTPNLMPRTELQDNAYKNPDNDPRGNWKASDLSARNFYSLGTYSITTPGGRLIDGPPAGRYWSISEANLWRLHGDNRIWWGKDGNNVPALKRFLSEVKDGVVPQTWWQYEEVGHTQDAKKEIVTLFGGEVFTTPKPERLIQRILHIATNPGDLVLDSFLGSGTTAAVAHKMGRRWIGIEMGEHARTHCLPRLEKVVAGESGGVSRAVGWGQPAPDGSPWNPATQGGGFRFMRLGEPIFDATGRIHPKVRFATLAAFIWQQETGSAYAPQEPGTHARPGTPLLGIYYENNSSSSFVDAGLSQNSSQIEPPEVSAGPLFATPTPQAPAPAEPRPRAALYLLFNGILGDKRPQGGNVLTRDVLAALLALHAQSPAPQAPLTVYGEACRLGPARLAQARVTFRHIPHDVRAG
jgi:adenine-specific DNA-methyltransferase